MNFDHTRGTIKRLCNHKNVKPIDLLAKLLHELQNLYLMKVGLSSITGNQASVYTEISEHVKRMGWGNYVPSSLIELLNIIAMYNQWLDNLNSQNENEPPRQQETLTEHAIYGETLHLILKQMMNEAERDGLKHSLILEEEAKKHGWTLARDLTPEQLQELGLGESNPEPEDDDEETK